MHRDRTYNIDLCCYNANKHHFIEVIGLKKKRTIMIRYKQIIFSNTINPIRQIIIAKVIKITKTDTELSCRVTITCPTLFHSLSRDISTQTAGHLLLIQPKYLKINWTNDNLLILHKQCYSYPESPTLVARAPRYRSISVKIEFSCLMNNAASSICLFRSLTSSSLLLFACSC